MRDEVEIAVVGAGVIGLTIALRLAEAGHEVMLVDPAPPGSGASFGNAGTVADYAVQPVGTPEVLRKLPSLLFDHDSPLAIRRAALPSLAPWLLRFARQSLPGAARRNAHTLAALVGDAAPRWRELAAAVGGTGLIREKGCIYWYETDRAAHAARTDLAFRRSLGVSLELLSASELAALEPGLPVTGGGGAWFPGAIFLSDPGEMVRLVAAAALAAGVRLIAARVERLTVQARGVTLAGPGLAALRARVVVIAAGAHGRVLAQQAGDKVPLDTERGYHVEYDMAAPRLERPVCATSRGFYLCPMEGRLRAAGTVELGGLAAPPSPHRIARLDAGARAVFADLEAPSRSWMGFRPSLPDSLPVIGTGRSGPRIIHAYGHGHIGITLAPVTAEIVADLVASRTPVPVAAALGPMRF